MRKETFKLLCSVLGINPNLTKEWIAALFSYLPGGTNLFFMMFKQQRAVALIPVRQFPAHIGHSLAKNYKNNL